MVNADEEAADGGCRMEEVADGGWRDMAVCRGRCRGRDDIDAEVERIEGVVSEMAVCSGWDEDV